MSTQIILLERVESLGQMGDVVSVKPGYARNFLLPQGKALRATKDNVAYFEGQKKTLEADNLKLKKEAEAVAKKIDGLKIVVVRSASEAGQLYGSVAARDIAEGVTEAGFSIEKSQVQLNQNFKMIGFSTATVVLHPEVKVDVTLNIARSAEEAKIQDKTGKALIAGAEEEEAEIRKPQIEAAEEAKSDFLEDNALEAEKAQAEVDAEKSAEAEAKAAEKAEKKAAKAVAEADAAEAEEATAEDADAETTEEKTAE